MFSIEDELYNHIVCEVHRKQPFNFELLFETRGVVDGISTFVSKAIPLFNQQVEATIESELPTKKQYDIQAKDLGVEMFFDEAELTLMLKYDEKQTAYGGDTKLNSVYQEKGKIIVKPRITISVDGSTYEKVYNAISFCLSHELTHCYNLYCYAKERGASNILHNIQNELGYEGILKGTASASPIERYISYFFYLTSGVERNAYIAQMRQELINSKAKTPNEVLIAMKDSQTWKKFKNCEDLYYAIVDITKPKEKEEVVSVINKLHKKKFTTFGRAIKYITNIWQNYSKKYLTITSKIAYDIINQNQEPRIY